MKRRSNAVVTATIAAILVLSTLGAGAAAAGPNPAADDAATDTPSQAPDTPRAMNDGDDATVSNPTADEMLEWTFSDLLPGLDAGEDASSLVDELFDDIDVVDETDGDETDDVGDDETDETGDDEADDDGSDDDGADDGTDDESDGDDSTDETGDNETDDDDSADETDGDTETDAELERAEIERYVHEAVNEERTDRGLEPLEFDTELRDIARSHSEDMAERGYFEHEDPDGNDFADRYDEAGYECDVNGYAGGENIAQTWYDRPITTSDGDTVRYENESELAEGVVTQWMNSPSHRENLLAPHWENEGIGVAVTDDDRVYATQNFC